MSRSGSVECNNQLALTVCIRPPSPHHSWEGLLMVRVRTQPVLMFAADVAAYCGVDIRRFVGGPPVDGMFSPCARRVTGSCSVAVTWSSVAGDGGARSARVDTSDGRAQGSRLTVGRQDIGAVVGVPRGAGLTSLADAGDHGDAREISPISPGSKGRHIPGVGPGQSLAQRQHVHAETVRIPWSTRHHRSSPNLPVRSFQIPRIAT